MGAGRMGESGMSGRSRLSGQSGVCQYDALGGGPLRPLQSTFAHSPASGCSELQPILLGFTDIVIEAGPEVL